ncbi:MAG TPA: uroporphyrinogen-III synthase [Rudaea sp.]|jgi:uroporphyrinogen-III synthase
MPKPTPPSDSRPRSDTGSLAGASVVVTRPAATAAALKQRIRRLGGTALGLPGLALRVGPDASAAKRALAAARSADVAIFVSPIAVRFAFALRPNLRFGRDTIVCAVGAATARALKRRGIARAIWPTDRQDSEGLLALAPLRNLRGSRVALIGAPGGRELLAQTLRARHARVELIHVYQRVAPSLSRRQLDELERSVTPLITLLTSAEALANLRATLPLRLFARLAAGDLIVSSERLAAAARASLFARIHIAGSPDSADLLQAAVATLTRHRL